MRFYFVKQHGKYKIGQGVNWCAHANSVKRLLAQGILSTKAPKPPSPDKPKEG